MYNLQCFLELGAKITITSKQKRVKKPIRTVMAFN